MTDDIEAQYEKKLALLRNQCSVLLQSFDTVHIFATKYDPETNDTISFNSGIGSWAARRGQIRDFMLSEDERVRVKERPQ